MPRVTLQLDTRKFDAAVRYVFEETHKALPDIVNRAALTTIIGGKGVQGAMQRTMKAARAVIMAVPVRKVAGRILKKHAGERLTRERMNQLISKEYRRRVAAIGYTARVGWSNAAIAFGGRGVGRRAGGRGYASEGEGIPARNRYYVAELSNTAPAAPLIGAGPLQDALNDVARDMIEHAGGKVEEVWRRASAS